MNRKSRPEMTALLCRTSRAARCLTAVLACVVLVGCSSSPDRTASSGSWWKFPSFTNPFSKTPETSLAQTATDAAAETDVEQVASGAPAGPQSEPAAQERLQHASATEKPSKQPPEFLQELSAGRRLESDGKHAEARAHYEQMTSKYPDRYEPFHRLGVVADFQRRYAEAESLYLQALALNREDPDLYNDLGYCYYLEGKLADAERTLREAVSRQPDNRRYRNNLGLVYGHLGNHEEALTQFRRGGTEADAYFNLAFVLVSQDNVEGARNCLRLALAADPKYDRAREALARFEPAGESSGAMLADQGNEQPSGIKQTPYVEGLRPGAEPAQAVSHTYDPETAGAATELETPKSTSAIDSYYDRYEKRYR